MKLEHTEEQRELGAAVADVLESTPEDQVSDALGEMGLLGVHVTEDLGGAGAGLVELAIVAEAIGRALPSSPFVVGSLLATGLAVGAGGPAGDGLVQEFASGAASGTAPWSIAGSRHTASGLSLEGERLSGTVAHVPFAQSADVLIIDALEGDEVRLVAVRITEGTVQPEKAFDLSEPLGAITFADAAAVVLADDAHSVLADVGPRVQAVLAAESVGTGRRVLDTAIDYAKTRTQFGRAIGSFQAIKHMLVDAHMALDAASALAHRAAVALDEGDSDAARLAQMAFSAASSAAELSARTSLQVFGGIGYTWEQGTHRYLRRARARFAQFGSPDLQLAAIADNLFPVGR